MGLLESSQIFCADSSWGSSREGNGNKAEKEEEWLQRVFGPVLTGGIRYCTS